MSWNSIIQTLCIFCVNVSGTAGITFIYLYMFLKILFFYFLESGREGEGEKHQCVVAFHMPPTGDLGPKPDMCPGWE